MATLRISKGISKIENLTKYSQTEYDAVAGETTLEQSLHTYTMLDGRRPVAYYGLTAVSLVSDIRYFWFLLRKEAEQDKISLLRKGKRTKLILPAGYKILTCVDPSKKTNTKFAKLLGFIATQTFVKIKDTTFQIYEAA